MSNELEIKLPLDIAHIRLPPVDLRVPDDDLYREYIEVSEGAGYVEEQGKIFHEIISSRKYYQRPYIIETMHSYTLPL